MYRRFHSPGVGAGLAVAVGSLHVEGPVQVEPGGSFGDFFNADPIAIDGPLWADHNASVAIGLENRYGALVSSIAGAVRATDPSTIQIHNTKVGGPVDINGGGGPNPILAAAGVPYPGYNFNDLEDNVILGPVSETGYNGIWSGVLRNVMAGLTFANNSEAPFIDEYDIGSNLITGPATCSGNDPAPNLGADPGAPSFVNGPTRGDQVATCAGVAGRSLGPTGVVPKRHRSGASSNHWTSRKETADSCRLRAPSRSGDKHGRPDSGTVFALCEVLPLPVQPQHDTAGAR